MEAIVFFKLPYYPSLYCLWFHNTPSEMTQPETQHFRQQQTLHLSIAKNEIFFLLNTLNMLTAVWVEMTF